LSDPKRGVFVVAEHNTSHTYTLYDLMNNQK
jgi:hypothetical protein